MRSCASVRTDSSLVPYTRRRINVTSKSIALAGSALTLLDYSSTLVVSAATASTYLADEVKLPFPVFVGTAIIVVSAMLVTMAGLKESARMGLTILTFHVSNIRFPSAGTDVLGSY